MTLTIILVYLVLVLLIGMTSHRLFQGTGEDYFLATRTIGPFILLMSLFGTHMTAFSLLGASGESYRTGIGVFGLMASSSALVVPAVFYFVGIRLWALGKRHGYVTQVQYFRERWNSSVLGLVLFIVLIALVIPYLLIGVMGGGMALAQITENRIPEWAGSLLVCAVVLSYVTYGGLRGTAWVNTFQTLVFMTLGAVTFLWILRELGGLEAAMARVAEQSPELLIRGEKVKPLKLLTYMCIPLSVGMFPHLFMHWLTARRAESFRLPVVAYPVCVAVVWIPSVLLGVIGSADIPGLEGAAANSILVRMIHQHAPELLAGLLGAGVFAAIMSSLDSQVLSLGTMFTHDIVRHHGFHDRMSEARQVLVGRVFVSGILLATYLLSLVVNRSIFKLGIWSFTGFAALFPVVLAALFWKRSTRHGVLASILTVAVLWVFFIERAWTVPGYTVGGTGVIPAAVILAASAVVLVGVSLVSRPPERQVLEKFFPRRAVHDMKLAYVTAGAAGMYCGSCLHDNTLAAELIRLGHDVALIPVYTPIRTDEEDVSIGRVFYGAVNVYLEQKSALFRHTPWLVDKILNNPHLLNWAASRGASSVDAKDLGELTLSVLQGEEGKQAKELDRLIEWLLEFRPDMVHLTNSMLLGMARRIREELGVPVICSLQGEDIFLDDLQEPWRERIHATLQERAKDVDGFFATSRYYAGHMAELLKVPRERINTVRLGIKLDGFGTRGSDRETEPFVVGYLARICPEKGLHLLVESFRALAESKGKDRVRLRIAGYLGPRDTAYFDGIREQIASWGLEGAVDHVGEVDRKQKIEFLDSLDVLSVPTIYREPKGIFVLEALASGVPVVQPRHGSFPEILEATGGGVLVEPESVEALATGLAGLMDDPAHRAELGKKGKEAIDRDFDDETMARNTLEAYARYLTPSRGK